MNNGSGLSEGAPRGFCNAGGRHRVSVGKTLNKARYETIDQAWSVAYRLFAMYGQLLTPYRCTPIVSEWGKPARPHPNPWSFMPWHKHPKTFARRRRQCCGGWHLSRSVFNMLNP